MYTFNCFTPLDGYMSIRYQTRPLASNTVCTVHLYKRVDVTLFVE